MFEVSIVFKPQKVGNTFIFLLINTFIRLTPMLTNEENFRHRLGREITNLSFSIQVFIGNL